MKKLSIIILAALVLGLFNAGLPAAHAGTVGTLPSKVSISFPYGKPNIFPMISPAGGGTLRFSVTDLSGFIPVDELGDLTMYDSYSGKTINLIYRNDLYKYADQILYFPGQKGVHKLTVYYQGSQIFARSHVTFVVIQG